MKLFIFFIQNKWRNFFRFYFLCYICFGAIVLFASGAHADGNLHIKPARCIALHEGQVCYQTLNIQWSAETAETYCLYQFGETNPLICWDDRAKGTGSYEFENNKSQKFILVRKRDAQVIAEFTVEVAWVYDASSHRESHWRIF